MPKPPSSSKSPENRRDGAAASREGSSGEDKRKAREARLADALRDNLRRRKARPAESGGDDRKD